MSHKNSARNPGLSWAAFKKEWQGWFANHALALRFCLKFGCGMAVFYGLGNIPFWYAPIYPVYLHGNAWLSGLVLDVLGQGVDVTGVTIRSSRYAIDIKPGCDALEPAGLFIAALLAYPATWRQRLLGIGAGLLVILPLNLIRIVALFLTGSYYPQFFPVFHLQIWPVVFIVTSLLLFIRWSQWSNRAAG